jgi:hypothetical protein
VGTAPSSSCKARRRVERVAIGGGGAARGWGSFIGLEVAW